MRTALALFLAIATAIALGGVGCSDLDNGSLDGSAGIVTPPLIAKPRPKVEILSPARGAFLAPGAVAVSGHTAPARTGGAAIVSLDVNGASVRVEPDGTFQTLVQVGAGINVIRATATDAAGDSGFAAAGVLAGTFQPLGTPVSSAIALRLSDPALGGIEKVIETIVTRLPSDSLAASVYNDSLLGMTADLSITTVRYSSVQVRLDAQPDGLHAAIDIAGVIIDASASLSIVTNPQPVQALVDAIHVGARVVPASDATGRLEIGFEDPTATIVNLRINVTSQIIQLAEALLRSVIRRALEREVVGLLQRTKSKFDPLDVDALGKPVRVDVRADRIAFDAVGLEVALRANCTPLNGPSARGLAAPGSFSTPGGPPMFQLARGVHAILDDDLLNRVAHGIWASGALDIDAATFVSIPGNAPTTGLRLVGRDLKMLLPELNAIVPDSSPVNIRVEALLPPVFRLAPPPDLLALEMSEVQVEIVFDRGNGWERVFRAALHLSLAVNLEIDSTGMRLSSGTTPRFTFDLLDEPLVEIDDRRVEVAGALVLTPVLPFLINRIHQPIPHLDGLAVLNVSVERAGNAGDHMSALADLSR